MGMMTVSDTLRIMEKMPGEKLAGVMPTSVAISPTRELTESKTPVRLPMIPLIRSSLSHSAIASRILPKSNTLSFHLVGQGGRAPPRPGYSGPCPASVSGGEQPGEQGDQGDTDEGDASARHQLFHALALGSGVVVAVALQKVDRAPHAEAGAQRHNEGLQHIDRTVEKCHIFVLLKVGGREMPPPGNRSAWLRKHGIPPGFMRLSQSGPLDGCLPL